MELLGVILTPAFVNKGRFFSALVSKTSSLDDEFPQAHVKHNVSIH